MDHKFKIVSFASIASVVAGLALAMGSDGVPITDRSIQPYSAEFDLSSPAGDHLKLINLNSHVNSWYVLEIREASGQTRTFHLEAPYHFGKVVPFSGGLLITDGGNKVNECRIFGVPETQTRYSEHTGKMTHDNNAQIAETARTQGLDLQHLERITSELPADMTHLDQPFNSICDGWLYIRKRGKVAKQTKEEVANTMRDWGLGSVVEGVKSVITDDPEKAQAIPASVASKYQRVAGMPLDARMRGDKQLEIPASSTLGIQTAGQVYYGKWTASKNYGGVYVSMMNTSEVPDDILHSYEVGTPDGRVRPYETAEANSQVYLVGMDLDQFEFGYALGDNDPGTYWSTRSPSYPGYAYPSPDGIAGEDPLQRLGMAPAYLADQTVATFVGGFCRKDGAFRKNLRGISKDLSAVNNGTHFGFVENGVVFSKLQPGLATAWVDLEGRMHLMTWPEDGQKYMPFLRHARQNNVPIIEGYDEKSDMSIPGKDVQVQQGIWSGAADGAHVTPRSGMCIQRTGNKEFLIYALFTGATQNAMARVFQSYHCSYAMLLDMNAPMHTFFSLSTARVDPRKGLQFNREYLTEGMTKVDFAPVRFLGVSDYRDTFYVTRKR